LEGWKSLRCNSQLIAYGEPDAAFSQVHSEDAAGRVHESTLA
jgi:hypothetical protein